MSEFDQQLLELESGPLHPFQEWPIAAVPQVAAGVYSIWLGTAELIYIGMSGRSLGPKKVASLLEESKRRGLWERLNSHASGGRSGDRFCIYVCDRLVLPGFSTEEIGRVASGALNLDAETRKFIRKHLYFRFVILPTGEDARELERLARSGSLRAGRPLLNPLEGGAPPYP